MVAWAANLYPLFHPQVNANSSGWLTARRWQLWSLELVVSLELVGVHHCYLECELVRSSEA